ncbi:MAG: hypothetical protein JST26_13975 [Bacteroidetes bacterium]|nr:hypothetical protein [Bacteroidota bacterium]
MIRLLYILIVCGCISAKAQNIGVEPKTGESGTHYTFFRKNNCHIQFQTNRPSKVDTQVVLCIPAAFTNLQNFQVDGIYAVDGKIGNRGKINTGLGGVFMIDHKGCRMFQSQKGKLFSDSLFKIIEATKASFFQQIQCIQNGKAASFKDQKLFQRRGIALMKDNSVAVVESTEAITLAVFSEDLVKLGVVNLIYTDMGAWDEGWYRDPKTRKILTIGKDLSQTGRQSNWIVFKK